MATMTEVLRSISQGRWLFDYGLEEFNAAMISAVEMQRTIDANGHLLVAAEPAERN